MPVVPLDLSPIIFEPYKLILDATHKAMEASTPTVFSNGVGRNFLKLFVTDERHV